MSQQPLSATTFPTPQDLADIQGDIVLGIPKRFETFKFFEINDVASFKKDLKQLIPLITSTADIKQTRDEIKARKAQGITELIKVAATNIAFSAAGLQKLGITDHLGNAGDSFENGQFSRAEFLADQVPKWIEPFKSKKIDGIILVAGNSPESVKEGISKVDLTLGKSVGEILKVEANARPGKERGHEHFGFKDGISNPAIPAITGQLPGQNEINPGILIVGQAGDPVLTRPSWTKNGSYLVYRHLEQQVPEFNKFLTDNPIVDTGLTREQGSVLRGARFFGRWKSGAPTDITPTEDDPALADDKERNNDFDFSKDKNQDRCPFSAHIRKTNPRTDLGKINGFDPETALKPHLINRQSIAFGPEVCPEEEQSGKTKEGIKRGLSFVCYQSNIEKGFEFVQKSWANNQGFPLNKVDQQGNHLNPGFDPIIGQNGNDPRPTVGSDPGNQTESLTLPFDFVVSNGGEYFFSPSISALKTKFAA